ncbi:hypothetical protein ACH5AO_34815 [Streptomyces sp. NPDC018964]|uniref:hypothetical protein n=1 Tax=unclassified Streptomyces TaxID=2593676 RepID=UPI003787BF5C
METGQKDEKGLAVIADLRVSPDAPEGLERPAGVPKRPAGGDTRATKSAPVAFGELEDVEHRPEWSRKVERTGWAVDGTEAPVDVRVLDSSSVRRTTADRRTRLHPPSATVARGERRHPSRDERTTLLRDLVLGL